MRVSPFCWSSRTRDMRWKPRAAVTCCRPGKSCSAAPARPYGRTTACAKLISGGRRPGGYSDMGDAFSLHGKVAIVTGAGSGIGRAIALAFGQAGAAVVCCDIDAAAAKATCQAMTSGRGLPLGCDVSKEADTVAAARATTEAFGAVHVLVNAAAP